MEPIRKKILLVEDEAIIALTEKRQLEQYGYAIKTVNTGEEAVEAVRTSSDIDLVLMDINLGDGIDGTQAAALILKSRDIPIVFLSSHTDPEIVEKTEKITSYGYVVKSSSITVLDASIKMAFKLFCSEKKAESIHNELLKTNSILRMTFEQSPIPMILVSMPDEKFKFLNTSAEKIFGISDEKSLVGTRLSDFKSSYNYFDANGNDLIIENLVLARVLKGEIVNSEERIIVTKNGQKRNVLVSGTPIHNNADMIGGYIAIIDISERIAMEANAQKSKEKAEMLLNVAAEIIISLDCQGGITLLNESGHKILGYDSPELVGKNWFDTCLLVKDRDEGRKKFLFLLEGESTSLVTHDSNVVTKNGELKTILWHSSVVKDKEGASIGVFSSGEDITERNENIRKLLDSEDKFSQIFHKSPYPILMIDTDNGKFSDVNEAMALSVEYSREELIGKSAVELGIISLESELQTRILIGEKGHFSDLEVMICTKSGKSRFGLATGWIIEINGHPFLIQTIVDVTERKQAEDALGESRERLQFALEVSGLGEWELDLKTNKVHRNKLWADMLGYSISEIEDSFQQGIDLQHPEDREVVQRAVQEYQAGKTDKFSVQYRMRTKDGAYKWIQDCGKVFERDEHGNPVRICGTHEDIDDKKKLESLILDSNSLLHSMFDSSPDVIVFALDTNYKYLAFNSRHKEVIKKIWGKDISIGTNMLEIIGIHADGKRAKDNFDRALSGESFVVVEDYGDEALSRQSWLDYWSPIKNTNGTIIGLTCFLTNNTKQKKAQEKIKKLLLEKELILKEVHHRIKNNMNTISSLLSLQADTLKDFSAIHALQDATSRIKSMSLLYDKLYQSPDYTELSMDEYLSPLINQVIENFPNGKNVKVNKNLHKYMLDVKFLQPLGIIINELLTNTMKYAFRETANGLVSVSATCIEGHIIITVEDDGIGIPESVTFENSTGFGLHLVYALAQQLDGTILLERDAGTRVILDFVP